MGLLDLLKESQENSPKRRSDDEPRLHFIDMSKKGYTNKDGDYVPSNQGTIKFLPIVGLDGKEIKYAYDVKCYNFEGEERNNWFRVMDPKDYDTELSDDQKALILQLRSLIDSKAEDWGFPYVDFKNYALMFGYILEHASKDDTVIIDKGNRQAGLLIFPSKNFAKAMTNCLKKINDYGDEIGEEMYNDLFSRNAERENYMTISFTKSEGFGYDVDISADTIDRKCVKILTADELKEGKVVIPESELEFCTYQSAVFFAGNHEDSVDFDPEYAEKVKKQIVKYIDDEEASKNASEKLPPLPNKNKKGKSDLDE